MRRVALMVVALLAVAGAPLSAQTVEVVGSSIAIGASPTSPTGSTVRLDGLGTTGGTYVLLGDATDGGNIRARLLGKADLPATVGYTDEAETWSLLQTFTSGLTSNGLLTIGGANDLLLGTGGMRAASGSILLRNIADSATIASFGDSAISLAQPTTITGNSSVTGTWGVSGLSTLTGGYSAGASSSIAGNLTLTGTGSLTAAGDVAVNGGDITSTAANLNLTPATSITLNGQTRLAASHTLQSANFASRTTGWGITYAGEADFRYTYADEFYTKNFIADLETALNGGQIIAKSTVVLATDFTCPAAGGTATLRVRDFPGHANLRVFAVSDWVVLRSMTRADADNDGNIEFSIGDCVGQVSAYADQADDTQTWTFTRGSGGNAGAMAASTVVAADALVIDYGVSGQGFLVARANDGTEGSQSPYWQVVTWTTAPVAANMALRARWGQLNGSYGYSSAEYGFAAGDIAGINITAEATNGFRIRSGTTNFAQMNSAGLTVGRTDSGYGNWFADTSGNLYGRSGTVNRIALSASNADVKILDDDGTTPRVSIGSGAAYFGSETGGRVQINYLDGSLRFHDSTGARTFYANSSGLILGRIVDSVGASITGAPYLSLTASALQFCEDGGTCPLSFDGSTGDITSTGSITLGTAGHIKAGATAYGTGTGFYLGVDSGTPKFYIGNGTGSSSNYLTWNGSALSMTGALTTDAGLQITGTSGTGAAINTGALSNLRIQNSTVLGTIELTASGGLKVYVDASNQGTGVTGTKTVRAAGGAADCTLIYVMGVLTGGTC